MESQQVAPVKSFEMGDLLRVMADENRAKTGEIARADDDKDPATVAYWISASQVGSRDMLVFFRDQQNIVTATFFPKLPAPPEVASLFLEICNRWNVEENTLVAAMVPDQGVILKSAMQTGFPLPESALLLWVGVVLRKAVRFGQFFEQEVEKL